MSDKIAVAGRAVEGQGELGTHPKLLKHKLKPRVPFGTADALIGPTVGSMCHSGPLGP